MPAPYRSRIVDHEVILASELDWQQLTNGKMLDAAEDAQFTVLVTIDKGIAHQQNMTNRSLSVILLDTADTRIAILDELVPDVLNTLASLEPGTLYVIKLRDVH